MSQITVNEIVIDVVRKNIRHLYLKVLPAGQVQITAPLKINDELVRSFVLSKLRWIEKRKKLFTVKAPVAYEYISGEHHYFLGKAYVLNVIYKAGHGKVVLYDESLALYVPPGCDLIRREKTLLLWYRKQMKMQIASLILQWEKVIGVRIASFHIKKMKTKWGTCNIGARRIWLNLELIKRPLHCLEYVVVHEMVHLLERYHNRRFAMLMDGFLPLWRSYKKELNFK
jgi:predicted metal-dependent hydrolase